MLVFWDFSCRGVIVHTHNACLDKLLRLKPHSDGAALNLWSHASCPRCILHLRLVDELEHSGGDRGPLDRKGGQEHVECNTSVAIATKERHQKPKSNKDHHMNILEDCWGERRHAEELGRNPLLGPPYIHMHIQ